MIYQLQKNFLFLSIASIILIANGCSVQNTSPEQGLYPYKSHTILKAISNSKECINPVPADVNLSKNFKYGCFCGQNYPTPTQLEFSKHYSDMSISEQESTLTYYYSIKPVDDIDQACRDHDICFLTRGEGDGECNREFRQRLDTMYSILQDISPRRHSLEHRCSLLAKDMSMVFLTALAKNKYKTPVGSTLSFLIHDVLGTVTLGAATAVLRPAVWADDPYPHQGEACILPYQYSYYLQNDTPSNN